MKLFLAADHAGFEAKEQVKDILLSRGYAVEDCGAFSYDPDDDYPDVMSIAARKVSENPEEHRAILFGGSGQGEAIAANRHPWVRAVVWYGPRTPIGARDISGTVSDDDYEIVRLARQHNDANVLSIGVRFVEWKDIERAITIWLEEKFSGDERHVRRIGKLERHD